MVEALHFNRLGSTETIDLDFSGAWHNGALELVWATSRGKPGNRMGQFHFRGAG
jgi:hypothetical protein